MAKKPTNEKTYHGIGVSPGIAHGSILVYCAESHPGATHKISSEEVHRLNNLPPDTILVAHDLSPLDTSSINPKNVIGLALEAGDHHSHTANFARLTGLPAVVGLRVTDPDLRNGQRAVLDGYAGWLVTDPGDSLLFVYEQAAIKRRNRDEGDKD